MTGDVSSGESAYNAVRGGDGSGPRAPWKELSPTERETFVAAIARHTRASWRVTLACAAAVTILAIIVAVLMAPLLYCSIALGFDVANLLTPTPDLVPSLARELDQVFSIPNPSPAAVLRIGVLAAVPGLLLMAAATLALRQVWIKSALFDVSAFPGRPPKRSELAEERLSNVAEEMAIAAGIPVPRIVIVPGGANGAACGRDESHVTLLIGEALATTVDREQLEGVIAHLIASIANGDMAIGLRVTTTLTLFGLFARAGLSFSDRQALRQTLGLWRVFFAPTSTRTAALLGALSDPFGGTPVHPRTTAQQNQSSDLTWREWILMPLMGPLVITGFFAGLVCTFLLEPLIALAWRQRKYMADATAVQLTRDPDALAAALASIANNATRMPPFTAHLAVAGEQSGAQGPFAHSMVLIFPSPQKRLAALVKMGSHVAPAASPPMPWLLRAFLAAVVLSIVAVLLVFVSTALSMLFTVAPAAVLHLVLRRLGR